MLFKKEEKTQRTPTPVVTPKKSPATNTVNHGYL